MDTTKYSVNTYIWQAILFWVITYTAIETPMMMAMRLPLQSWQLWLELIIASVFFADWINQFRKKFSTQTGDEELSPINDGPSSNSGSLLWHIVDILCFIPFTVISFSYGLPLGLSILRLVRVFRLIRIIKTFSIVGSVNVVPQFVKLQFVILWSLIATHWIACGWMIINPIDAATDLMTFYNKSLYWAITTLTTIGYGDIVPTTNSGRVYTMMIMILGVGVYGLVIGNVTKLIYMADHYKEQTREKINDLTLFMRHYDIPARLQRDVLSFYNHLFTKRLSENDTQIISELPHALQADLQIYMNLKLISGVPVFQFCPMDCLKEIAAALEQKYFSPGQKIIERGEIGNEMYIIGHGQVDVFVENGQKLATISDGQFFGEVALLQETKRSADIKASTYCDLYKLSKDDFLSIIERYPELKESMYQVIRKRKTDRRNHAARRK